MSDVYDAGNTEDKGKPNGEKGVYTPADETATMISITRFI